MKNVNTNNVKVEIEDLFVDFFRSNLSRLEKQLPSMRVDGETQWYRACLPDHISSKLQPENQNPV